MVDHWEARVDASRLPDDENFDLENKKPSDNEPAETFFWHSVARMIKENEDSGTARADWFRGIDRMSTWNGLLSISSPLN